MQSVALRRVYVRAARHPSTQRVADYGWRAAPDPGRAADEHDAFRATLEAVGRRGRDRHTPRCPATPTRSTPTTPRYPPTEGVIVLRPGKPGAGARSRRRSSRPERRRTPDARPRSTAPATAEGGDMFWLDDAHPARRTRLPHERRRASSRSAPCCRARRRRDRGSTSRITEGPTACLHLMSFISPLDRDLAVVFLPMVPVRLLELLRDRGVALVEVPEEEFDSQGPNVLALAPARRARARGQSRDPPAHGGRRRRGAHVRRARRSPARVTAARPASPARSSEPDGAADAPALGSSMLPRDVSLLGRAAHPRRGVVPAGPRCVDVRALPDPRRSTSTAARIVDTITFSGAHLEADVRLADRADRGRVRRRLPGQVARRLVALDRGGVCSSPRPC